MEEEIKKKTIKIYQRRNLVLEVKEEGEKINYKQNGGLQIPLLQQPKHISLISR